MNYYDISHKVKTIKITDDSELVKFHEKIILIGVIPILAYFLLLEKSDFLGIIINFLTLLLCFGGIVYILECLWVKRAIKKFGEVFSSFLKEQKIKGIIFLIIFSNIDLTDEQIDFLIDSYNQNEGKSMLNSPIIDLIFQKILARVLEKSDPLSFILFLIYLPIFSILKLKKEKNDDFILMLNWYKQLRDDLKK